MMSVIATVILSFICWRLLWTWSLIYWSFYFVSFGTSSL